MNGLLKGRFDFFSANLAVCKNLLARVLSEFFSTWHHRLML